MTACSTRSSLFRREGSVPLVFIATHCLIAVAVSVQSEDVMSLTSVTLDVHSEVVEVKEKHLMRREKRRHETLESRRGLHLNFDHVFNHAEDCNTTALTTTTTSSTTVVLSGINWRLRVATPCKVFEDEDADNQEDIWELSQVSFHGVTCGNADSSNALTPLEIVDSGVSDVSYNKELAFDDDASTFWRGVEDDSGDLFLEVRFNQSTEVKCARFFQCNCDRSVRQAVLEVELENWGTWYPASFASAMTDSAGAGMIRAQDVNWGEWTYLAVK